MFVTSRRRVFACVLLTLVLGGATVRAQEVQWRTDYNTAMREASDKKRPLLLDVGKDNCLHCVKLDISTFRDPTVAKILNESFIPVKVDGERNSVQVQGQVVQAFPTLIFIAPDNKVLLVQEGYLDAAALLPQLQQMLAALAPKVVARSATPAAAQAQAPNQPKTPSQTQAQSPVKPSTQAKAPSQPQAATQPSSQAQTPSQAKTPSQPVPPVLGLNGSPGPTPQAKSATSPFQADTKIGPVDGRRPVWPAPREPAAKSNAQNYQPVEDRAARAKQLLSLAQEDYQRQQWLACLEHCKTLILLYPDVQESLEARQLSLRIKSNPDLLERLGRDLTENLAEVYWELAQTKLRQNQASQAVPYLEKIVQACPGTRFTAAAQDYLSRLTASPGRPTRTGVRTH